MKVKQQKYEMIAQKPHCENFIPIQTKDFHCLNSDNLRKRNLSNGRFSVTATVAMELRITHIFSGRKCYLIFLYKVDC